VFGIVIRSPPRGSIRLISQIRRVVRGGVAVATPPRTTLYALAAVALERAKARSSATAASM